MVSLDGATTLIRGMALGAMHPRRADVSEGRASPANNPTGRSSIADGRCQTNLRQCKILAPLDGRFPPTAAHVRVRRDGPQSTEGV